MYCVRCLVAVFSGLPEGGRDIGFVLGHANGKVAQTPLERLLSNNVEAISARERVVLVEDHDGSYGDHRVALFVSHRFFLRRYASRLNQILAFGERTLDPGREGEALRQTSRDTGLLQRLERVRAKLVDFVVENRREARSTQKKT